MSPTFRALGVRNYRLYAMGSVVSNTGTWMQRIAQDWLVLQLFHGNAAAASTALGITTGLQFLPILLLSPYAGLVADRMPKRRLLQLTQAWMAVSSVILAVLVWGAAIAGFGLVRWLPAALVLLAVAGCADVVSAIFRGTIMQLAAPDALRGRLMGLQMAAVTVGPKAGDAETGAVAAAFGPAEDLLTMLGAERACAAVTLALLVAAVILTLVLVPLLGLTGAALAAGLVTAGRGGVLALLAHRRLGLLTPAFTPAFAR